MILSSVELARIREVVDDMLERLGLQTYLFEVDPREGPWEVRVECATPEGAWQIVTIALDAGQLRASLHDEAARAQVLAQLASHLEGCRRDGAGRAQGPDSA